VRPIPVRGVARRVSLALLFPLLPERGPA
jgi:hypothetical protein